MKRLLIMILVANINQELRKKLPYKDYKFVETFDETKYG